MYLNLNNLKCLSFTYHPALSFSSFALWYSTSKQLKIYHAQFSEEKASLLLPTVFVPVIIHATERLLPRFHAQLALYLTMTRKIVLYLVILNVQNKGGRGRVIVVEMQEAFWYVTTEKLRVRLINNLADISKRRVGFLQGHSPLFTHIMSAPTQDMPPSGGYSQVRYRRYLPKRGPSGAVIIAGVTAFCTFGFYRVAQGNLERRCVF